LNSGNKIQILEAG